MEWISTEKRMPPAGKRVLIWAYDNYFIGSLVRDLHDGEEILALEGWNVLIGKEVEDVKAWAELPDPFREGE